MSTARTIARNTLWNWTGMVVNLAAGFVVAPFLVHQLGQTGYGLWILIASLTGYFTVFDLGLGSSAGWNVAYFRARNDHASVNLLVSTALVLLAGVALVILLATWGLTFVFFALFDVEPAMVADVRLALWLTGINLALANVLGIFDGILSAYQRFDLHNLVDVPVILVRVALTFLVIGNGYGLVALALITLVTTFGSGLAKMIICYSLDASLRFRWRSIRKDMVGCLSGYGFWYFLLTLARNITPQISPQVIGNRLGVALVTPFSVAQRLLAYAQSFLSSGTHALTPVATGLHAQEKNRQQQVLFIEGGKYCLLLVLFFLPLFLFLGQPFLVLWMGAEVAASAGSVLIILVVGELLPMSQWATYSMILGMGRHKVTALLAVGEGLLILLLSVLLGGIHGLVGIAVGVALSGTLCRGFGQLVYGSRLVGVPWVTTYLRRGMVPAMAVAAGPAIGLALLTTWHVPASWLALFAFGTVYACAFLAVAVLGLPALRQHLLAWKSEKPQPAIQPAEEALARC